MIVSKIFQGLGNQFFQYAYGFARAKDLNTELKIDISYFDKHATVTQFGQTYTRDFGLNRFNIKAKQASDAEINAILHPKGDTLAQKIQNRYRLHLAPSHHKFYVKETELHFLPNLLNLKDNTYVEGYFTDERYFKPYRNELIDQFSLRNPPSKQNQEILHHMGRSESVCISIRRTNFLNNPLHGTCGEDYYHNAMDLMASYIKNPLFFVFSDDNDWINAHFKTSHKTVYIQHNYPDFYEDFRLMAGCKHHIIPNSTFPWWAAWLSNHPDKIVIAPKHWLKDTEINFSGYLPAEWEKLEHTIHTKFKGD